MGVARADGLELDLKSLDDYDRAGDPARFIVWKTEAGLWRWHLLNMGLTKVLARSGLSYASEEECVEAIKEVVREAVSDIWMVSTKKWCSADVPKFPYPTLVR